MATMPEEFRIVLDRLGDQRAKNLIDTNEGEIDPRRAIRRLHRALRYGRHTLYAARAYQDLGKYHEQLGNASRAILYYTHAIERYDSFQIKPIPALYWRGRLLAQRDEREAARRDFERALPLDEPTWFPEERDSAKRYLAAPTA
jgi:tetratricopeptide (TPR) repeat protein